MTKRKLPENVRWTDLPAKLRRELVQLEKRRRLAQNPAQWIIEPRRGEIIPLRWTDRQLEAFERRRGKKLFGVIGANRMGKTVWAAGCVGGVALGVDPLAWKDQPADPRQWKLGPPRKVWCLTTSHEKSRAVQQAHVWQRLRPWIKNTWRPASGFYNSIAELVNGSLFAFKTHEQSITEMESEAVDALWIDETVRLSFVMAGLLRLIDKGGFAIWTTIPDQPWLDDLFVKRQLDPASQEVMSAEDVDFIGGVMRDNPHLGEKEIAQTERMLPGAEREMRIFGKFVVSEGLVYADYVEELHLESIELPISSDWTRYEVIDPGWDNPCAVLFAGLDRSGVTHCYAELYYRHKTVGEIAAMVYLERWIQRGLMTPTEILKYRELCADQVRQAGDPVSLRQQVDRDEKLKRVIDAWRATKGDCRPRLVIIDEYAKQRDQAKPVSCLQQFADFGIVGVPASNSDKPNQRLKVRQLLRPIDGFVRFKVDERCTWLRWELTHHRKAAPHEETGEYPDDRERVLAVNNHLISCVEYLVSNRPSWEPPAERPAPSGTVAGRHQELMREQEAAAEADWRRKG